MHDIYYIVMGAVWTVIGILWYRGLVRPHNQGRIALRTVNELLREMGYDVHQYNHIEETSIYPKRDNVFTKISENFSNLKRDSLDTQAKVSNLEKSQKAPVTPKRKR